MKPNEELISFHNTAYFKRFHLIPNMNMFKLNSIIIIKIMNSKILTANIYCKVQPKMAYILLDYSIMSCIIRNQVSGLYVHYHGTAPM